MAQCLSSQIQGQLYLCPLYLVRLILIDFGLLIVTLPIGCTHPRLTIVAMFLFQLSPSSSQLFFHLSFPIVVIHLPLVIVHFHILAHAIYSRLLLYSFYSCCFSLFSSHSYFSSHSFISLLHFLYFHLTSLFLPLFFTIFSSTINTSLSFSSFNFIHALPSDLCLLFRTHF
jgi:hypothetical protein